ncbi:MAG: 2-amino-4-hydroxy-6-hydroxymethyldihydropteridine diphosphokinase [Chthoniobacterales bacterium]
MQTGIALGSNLGDRLAGLRAGRDFLLALHEGPAPAAVSPVYETDPVGCPPGSFAFLNAVLEIETSLEPDVLLTRLAAFEHTLGRPAERSVNAPRPLDLDILYAGANEIRSADLTLPHPRLAERRFVLQPLADLRPHLVLPGQSRSVWQLLAALPAEPQVRPFGSVW